MFVYQRVLLVAEAWIPVPLPSKQLRHIDRSYWIQLAYMEPDSAQPATAVHANMYDTMFLYIYTVYIYILHILFTSLRLSKVSYGQITIFIAYIS